MFMSRESQNRPYATSPAATERDFTEFQVVPALPNMPMVSADASWGVCAQVRAELWASDMPLLAPL